MTEAHESLARLEHGSAALDAYLRRLQFAASRVRAAALVPRVETAHPAAAVAAAVTTSSSSTQHAPPPQPGRPAGAPRDAMSAALDNEVSRLSDERDSMARSLGSLVRSESPVRLTPQTESAGGHSPNFAHNGALTHVGPSLSYTGPAGAAAGGPAGADLGPAGPTDCSGGGRGGC